MLSDEIHVWITWSPLAEISLFGKCIISAPTFRLDARGSARNREQKQIPFSTHQRSSWPMNREAGASLNCMYYD